VENLNGHCKRPSDQNGAVRADEQDVTDREHQ